MNNGHSACIRAPVPQKSLNPIQIKSLAEKLSVSEQEVIDMDSRMSGDKSLNVNIYEGTGVEIQDTLICETDIEQELINENEGKVQRLMLANALKKLNKRERTIFMRRRLKAVPDTLEVLSSIYNISRERIRQIEFNAFAKIKKTIQALA